MINCKNFVLDEITTKSLLQAKVRNRRRQVILQGADEAYNQAVLEARHRHIQLCQHELPREERRDFKALW